MYLFSWLFTNPPLAMATVDEVPYRSPVPLQWELVRQTEIFLEDSLCMFFFPVVLTRVGETLKRAAAK